MTMKEQQKDPLDRVYEAFIFGIDTIREIFLGVKAGTIPWLECMIWGIVAATAYNFELDVWFWRKLWLLTFYPESFYGRLGYIFSLMFSGFFMWGIYRAAVKLGLLRRLTSTFRSINLKNALGQLPQFIKDEPLDAHTRLLRLTKRCLPMERFTLVKPALESALQVYIDDMRDNRKAGTIDIIYAREPMPENIELKDFTLSPGSFVIGETRSGRLLSDFNSTPHLLVAGQTGGGKSTCIRQWITTLYLSNPGYEFTLIDLKGGLEFQTFEKLPRITVFGSVADATDQLSYLGEVLESRMKELKENEVKDIDSLKRKQKSQLSTQKLAASGPSIDRHIIVIDEAAELFLTGGDVSATAAQKAREVVSKIARQGRAVGLNLIIGTQRPDARALDTQVKANLTGKICFQMSDQHSSLVVLGNVRAKDLPPVPGRAIWQNGVRQIEVQVPYLSIDQTEVVLKPHKENTKAGNLDHDIISRDL